MYFSSFCVCSDNRRRSHLGCERLDCTSMAVISQSEMTDKKPATEDAMTRQLGESVWRFVTVSEAAHQNIVHRS